MPRSRVEKRAFEVRFPEDPDGKGAGLVEGVLLTYGQQATDRRERFERGALQWPDGRIVLNL